MCHVHVVYVTLLSLKTRWTSSTLYQVFSLRLTFFTLLPCLPICVATWINPLLCVKMAGILNPTAQQFPSPLVKRRSSATFPFLRLSPSNELMYKENSTLNAGPQVGIVPTRLLWTAGAPSEERKSFYKSKSQSILNMMGKEIHQKAFLPNHSIHCIILYMI